MFDVVDVVHHAIDHFGNDLLSHVVLPKDLGLLLVLPHQVPNPHILVLAVLDERVDVLRHLIRRCPILQDVLLVLLEHSHDFLEVVLVLLDFLHKLCH